MRRNHFSGRSYGGSENREERSRVFQDYTTNWSVLEFYEFSECFGKNMITPSVTEIRVNGVF